MAIVTFLGLDAFDILQNYKKVLKSIAGNFMEVNNCCGVGVYVKKNYLLGKLLNLTFIELSKIATINKMNAYQHISENVKLMLFQAHFIVA